MSKIYNEDNIGNIAKALLKYKDNKNCSKNWKKDLKEEFDNGTNQNEYLEQLKNHFDFNTVLKAVSNRNTKDDIVKHLNNHIK